MNDMFEFSAGMLYVWKLTLYNYIITNKCQLLFVKCLNCYFVGDEICELWEV